MEEVVEEDQRKIRLIRGGVSINHWYGGITYENTDYSPLLGDLVTVYIVQSSGGGDGGR